MDDTILETSAVTKLFPLRRSLTHVLLRRPLQYTHAVERLSIKIKKGEIVALVGESGSGKTTAGRLMIGLERPSAGEVIFRGERIDQLTPKQMKPLRRNLQMVYQDPYASLNPKLRIKDTLLEPLKVNGLEHSDGVLLEYLTMAGLRPPEKFLYRYPHELSGGQRQRVCIARAMVLNPEFVVADEPVSMLDVSMRSEILNVIRRFNNQEKTSFLLITHDLAVAAQIADRVAVMYLGALVEEGPTQQVLNHPLHPYTKALMSVVPRVGGSDQEKIVLKGEVTDARDIPQGCRFHPRCPYAFDVCRTDAPQASSIEGHLVECHLATTIQGNR
ncbi:MAG: ABC transporter ATP-binding protein [Candidatus Marsarchaeota archaeon]|nr:ABC transporter ATP-binding protein [Candidatus Marsarchaeota archaeon]